MDNLNYTKANSKNYGFDSPVRKAGLKRNINYKNLYKDKKFTKARGKANSLFGEMRNLTKEETKEYRNILYNDFQNTGVNFFDIL